VAVITGVGRQGQVGEAVAQAFAAAGWDLVLIDRNAQEVQSRAHDLEGSLARVLALSCDLTDVAAVQLAADSVAAKVDGVHALVCLAGGFAADGTTDATPPETWQRMLDINVSTAVTTTRAFLPLVRRAKGAVLYFASAAALPGARTAGMSAYAAAKAAVVSFMQTVAQEERANGVRANALAPTAIRTASNMSAMGAEASFVEREEVAHWVLQLCHPEVRSITGQLIRLG
jgi:NAD(P)-dependent dehydrogenase (short-subunit alcohol dehydrogenase family)